MSEINLPSRCVTCGQAFPATTYYTTPGSDIKSELQNLNLQIATLIGLFSDMKKSLERMERQACG